jgi:ATP-dependent DNA helicase RecQ
MLGKPPYVVFADDTLREMARVKPRTREAMLKVRGVGEHKLREYGERFLQAIAGHGA